MSFALALAVVLLGLSIRFSNSHDGQKSNTYAFMAVVLGLLVMFFQVAIDFLEAM